MVLGSNPGLLHAEQELRPIALSLWLELSTLICVQDSFPAATKIPVSCSQASFHVPMKHVMSGIKPRALGLERYGTCIEYSLLKFKLWHPIWSQNIIRSNS